MYGDDLRALHVRRERDGSDGWTRSKELLHDGWLESG
jgi:hypothetical protein